MTKEACKVGVLLCVLATMLLPTASAQDDAPSWYNESHEADEAYWEEWRAEHGSLVSNEANATRDTILIMHESLLSLLRDVSSKTNLSLAMAQNASVENAVSREILMALATRVQALDQNLTDVRVAGNETRARVRTLDANTTQALFEVRGLNTSVSRLDLTIQGLAELQNVLGDVSTRFDRIETSIYALQVNLSEMDENSLKEHNDLNRNLIGLTRLGLATYNGTSAIYNGTRDIATAQAAFSLNVSDTLQSSEVRRVEGDNALAAAMDATFRGVRGWLITLVLAVVGTALVTAFLIRKLTHARPRQNVGRRSEPSEYLDDEPFTGSGGGEVDEVDVTFRPPPSDERSHTRPPMKDVRVPPRPKLMSQPTLPSMPQRKGILAKLGFGKQEILPEEVLVANELAEQYAEEHHIDPRSVRECYGTRPDEQKCYSEAGNKACVFLDLCSRVHRIDPESVRPNIDVPAAVRGMKGEMTVRRTHHARATVSEQVQREAEDLPDMEYDQIQVT